MKMDVFSSVHVYDVYIIFQKTKSLLTGIIPSTCSHSNVTIALFPDNQAMFRNCRDKTMLNALSHVKARKHEWYYCRTIWIGK